MIDDIQLRQRLLYDLRWDPRLDATHVGVTAAHGAVTLSGHVDSYAELFAVRRVARSVDGVKAVADDIEVRLPTGHERDDSDIAESIAHVLSFNVSLPDSDVRAEVRDGVVTLHGSVDWQAQRRHVENQMAHVAGVRMIHNQIRLSSRPRPVDVKTQIKDAPARNVEDAEAP